MQAYIFNRYIINILFNVLKIYVFIRFFLYPISVKLIYIILIYAFYNYSIIFNVDLGKILHLQGKFKIVNNSLSWAFYYQLLS